LIREHNFSGVFYPKNYADLIAEMEKTYDTLTSSSQNQEFLQMIREYMKNKRILSFLIPHASLKYSGLVSAFAYLLIRQFDCNTFIILSSDHKGTSPGLSVNNSEYWTTPLGKVKTNQKIISDLVNGIGNGFLVNDQLSFEIDHTIELQLPFIQFGNITGEFDIVPILQKNQDKLTSKKLAKLLTSVLPKEQNIVLLCTSNLTHYLNYDECYNADKLIISEILKLDVDSFYEILEKYSRLICGYGCIATAMEFSKIIGNSDAILLNQSNSGDIDGNKSSVVGYTSIMMV